MAILTTTAAADAGGQNDAGSGADAGNTRADALAVSIGSTYLNNKLRVDDVDWYAASAAGASATCVRARVSANAPTYFALGAESPGLTLTAPFFADAGQDASAGIAGIAPLTATLRAAQARSDLGLSKYNFTIERVDLPASGGDAGTSADAGDGATGSLPVSPGCVGGTLSALDVRDTFDLPVVGGELLTYTLASTSGATRLTLLDALGNALGPTIAPGESASTPLSAPDTYYLSVAQPGSLSQSSYSVGLILGPEPSSCRPYCLT